MIVLIVVLVIVLVKGIVLLTKREIISKGELGEKKVNTKLSKIKNYKLIKDVLITNNSGTTQIDHILVGPKGIFVIETKNFSGYIFGNEWDREWTQALFGKRNKFYNPIRQNYGHIKAIENILPKKYIKDIYSIIVFSNECKLKIGETKTPVIYIKKLNRTIKKFQSNNYLDEFEIEEITSILIKENIKRKSIRKRHVKKIQKKLR